MAVGDAHVFPGFLRPVLPQFFFPKPPTTFLTCFCRGERQKYPGKKVRLNRGSNSQSPGHESDTLTTEPSGRSSLCGKGLIVRAIPPPLHPSLCRALCCSKGVGRRTSESRGLNTSHQLLVHEMRCPNHEKRHDHISFKITHCIVAFIWLMLRKLKYDEKISCVLLQNFFSLTQLFFTGSTNSK